MPAPAESLMHGRSIGIASRTCQLSSDALASYRIVSAYHPCTRMDSGRVLDGRDSLDSLWFSAYRFHAMIVAPKGSNHASGSRRGQRFESCRRPRQFWFPEPESVDRYWLPDRRDGDFRPQLISTRPRVSGFARAAHVYVAPPPRAPIPLPDRRDDNFRPQHPSPTVGTTTLGLNTPPRPSGRRL